MQSSLNPYGFQNKELIVQTRDGLDDLLLDGLRFIRSDGRCFEAPVGSTTDGLSTPKIIRILPGYDATGDDWWSGVVHDAAYRKFLKVFNGVQWEAANLTQREADHLILDAMKSQGVGRVRRHIIFYALRLFGGFAFRGDRIQAAKEGR